MTRDRDIQRVLDHWLTERPTMVADRVLDEVADRIARQPQEPAWRVSRRDIHVNQNLKALLAIAAVIIVAVAGVAVLLPPSGSNVGGPAPTASPTAAPTAAPSTRPSPTAAFPAWFTPESDSHGTGILSPGSQTTRSFLPAFTYSVPESWVNTLDEPIAYGLFPDTPANAAEYAVSGETAHGIFVVSVDTPYFFCAAWEKNRGTAAERAAFLVASDAFAVSEPVNVTIGGLPGKQVDVRLAPDWTETCPGDPPGHDLGDQRTRVIYLDTPGRSVIAIAVGGRSAGHEAFLGEAMPIIESFDFTP